MKTILLSVVLLAASNSVYARRPACNPLVKDCPNPTIEEEKDNNLHPCDPITSDDCKKGGILNTPSAGKAPDHTS